MPGEPGSVASQDTEITRSTGGLVDTQGNLLSSENLATPKKRSDFWGKPIDEKMAEIDRNYAADKEADLKAKSENFLKGQFTKSVPDIDRKQAAGETNAKFENLTPEQAKEKAWEEEKARTKATTPVIPEAPPSPPSPLEEKAVGQQGTTVSSKTVASPAPILPVEEAAIPSPEAPAPDNTARNVSSIQDKSETDQQAPVKGKGKSLIEKGRERRERVGEEIDRRIEGLLNRLFAIPDAIKEVGTNAGKGLQNQNREMLKQTEQIHDEIQKLEIRADERFGKIMENVKSKAVEAADKLSKEVGPAVAKVLGVGSEGTRDEMTGSAGSDSAEILEKSQQEGFSFLKEVSTKAKNKAQKLREGIENDRKKMPVTKLIKRKLEGLLSRKTKTQSIAPSDESSTF